MLHFVQQVITNFVCCLVAGWVGSVCSMFPSFSLKTSSCCWKRRWWENQNTLSIETVQSWRARQSQVIVLCGFTTTSTYCTSSHVIHRLYKILIRAADTNGKAAERFKSTRLRGYISFAVRQAAKASPCCCVFFVCFCFLDTRQHMMSLAAEDELDFHRKTQQQSRVDTQLHRLCPGLGEARFSNCHCFQWHYSWASDHRRDTEFQLTQRRHNNTTLAGLNLQEKLTRLSY